MTSVGIVVPQKAQFSEPLALKGGGQLDQFEIVYECYGSLNENKDNAVLVIHALSGDHHAAGKHSEGDEKEGWWNEYIGPGKPIDTNKFFVVCPNNIGGCRGSTGPLSISPVTEKLYGPDFPVLTTHDWVQSQDRLRAHLGVEIWAAVIGGSLGGMTALQWAIDLPSRVKHLIMIAVTPKLSAQNIAFNEVARQAIRTDPEFFDGRYFEHNTVPRRGLMLARMLGHITYLSEAGMWKRFGRELREEKFRFDFDVDFQVESYLRYQGNAFVNRFDANTYLLMTKMLDYFDPGLEYENNLAKACERILAKALLISFSTDWRFPTSRARQLKRALVRAGVQVSYAEIESPHGHDSFLIDIPLYKQMFSAYMGNI